MMMKPIATVIFALLFLGPALPAAGEDPPVLTVGHVGHDHQIALYVAAEAGRTLEKDYGVYLTALKDQEVYELHDGGRQVARIHLVRVGGGSKMPAALEQGHIEVGLGGLGPVAKFVDKGAPIKVLAPLNNDGDALVAGKHIPAASWQEFVAFVKASDRPVRIGYKAPMAVAYMILSRALAEEGIRFGQEPIGKDGKPVQVITMNLQGLDNALPSLESGVVDALVANEPMVSLLVHKGAGNRVADLSTLPPPGMWEGHPCCVVAARAEVLGTKAQAVKSLLKAIAAGADLMAVDRERALAAEAIWTRTDPEVGRSSIANVSYVIRPDADWQRGVGTWIELMTTSNHFHGKLKGKSTSAIRDTLLVLEPVEAALSEITLRSDPGMGTQ